jgi:hypothetical protein
MHPDDRTEETGDKWAALVQILADIIETTCVVESPSEQQKAA